MNNCYIHYYETSEQPAVCTYTQFANNSCPR